MPGTPGELSPDAISGAMNQGLAESVAENFARYHTSLGRRYSSAAFRRRQAILQAPARTISLADVERDIVLQRKFSWLVRRRSKNYLKRFEVSGLIIEKDKKG